ncbi:MAG TPA: O-antigen ligase family protein, partial [Candidatus Polarisedimenticolaceae bacterium]|nr:O-antigen ligase family protein [Candidatus Polarisedimenticolaceae bacterium]
SANLPAAGKQQVIKGYLLIAAATALYGFYLYVTGDYNRLTSAFYWANPCAAFLLPAFLIGGWRWITGRRWLPALQVLCIGTAFWLTDSRGAVLAAGVILASCLAVPAVRRRAGWIVMVGAVTFVVSLGLVQIKAQVAGQSTLVPGSRFAEAASGESTSVRDRLNYLGSAVQIWKDHPLTGTGAGTFGTVHPGYQQRVISAANDPHSLLAATLAEQGLIGVLILVYLGTVLAWGMWRGVRREPRLGVIAVSAVVLALHFCLDIDARYPALVVLLALLVGLTYQPWRHRPVPPARRLILPAALLAALVIGVSGYLSDTQVQQGRIHDENHDLALAAAAYGKAHSGVVYNPDAWTAEGIDYYTLAALTGGSKHYLPMVRDRARQAIRRDPYDSQHYFLLGRVERLEGHPDAAVQAYRQALRFDHLNHPEYYADLGGVLLQQGDAVAARRVIETGLELYPEAVMRNRSTDPRIKPAITELKRLQAALPPL